MSSSENLSVLDDNTHWIIRYIDTVENYRTYFGGGYEVFVETELYQDACMSKLNQICQCANRIRDHYPKIYEQYMDGFVSSIVSMRNIITHQYENVNLEPVWIFITKEMPCLREICMKIVTDLLNK